MYRQYELCSASHGKMVTERGGRKDNFGEVVRMQSNDGSDKPSRLSIVYRHVSTRQCAHPQKAFQVARNAAVRRYRQAFGFYVWFRLEGNYPSYHDRK